MANIKFTNFARTTLAIGLAPGSTSITVASGTGARFPALGAGEYFYLTLENAALTREIVKVTARASDVLTVARAQDNTSDLTWNAGDTAALRFNAAAIEEAGVIAGVVSGDLAFTGTANRITGDFSNATVANRVMFKTSTVNGGTVVSAIPNGSASSAHFRSYGNSDPTNASFLGIRASGVTEVRVESGIEGSGTYLPMTFYTGGSERMRIDTSGNVTVATQTAGDNSTKVATTAYVETAVAAGGGGAQIRPISASVAANALTVSASALSLDFRSATLGSGSVTKVSGTPANLVISSGSTLGTVNAQQSRIVVLAINFGGTIELAAVNIAGGNDLSETGLINTTAEGGAGGADTANVIYSTTARTGVAYRVIGYIESTQATAGTWVTAPSTIQGCGGQALSAMSSLGYGQTWQNVTGSRTIGTTYYNTTGRPISVAITYTGAAASIIVGGITVYTDQSAVSGATTTGTTFIVPEGAAYSVAGCTLSSWAELR